MRYTAVVFVGVDQSLNGTGLCLLDDEGQLVKLETVDPGGLRRGARLSYIKRHLESLLETGEVVAACREGYSYGSVGRVFELGEVGGLIELFFYEQEIDLQIVAPTALKKFATGNSSAPKDMMMRIAENSGAPVRSDDEADAFFLARVAYHLETGVQPDTRAAMEVLKQLRSPSLKPPKRRLRKIVPDAL
jgi:crossover junction endodeoxyribonuclease RuvC